MNRPVKISFALNGFVAEVGCQTLVFNDLTQLLGDLQAYLKDPEAAEKHFRANALNTKVTLGDYPQPVNGYAEHAVAPREPWPTDAPRGAGALAGSTCCQG